MLCWELAVLSKETRGSANVNRVECGRLDPKSCGVKEGTFAGSPGRKEGVGVNRNNVVVHKENSRTADPLVSIILLDWSVREWFQALEWLPKQDVPREKYELIWIELYDRIVPEAMEIADVVITCGQQGRYDKHRGYNVGLLQARGQVVTVCDSDAVFSPDFISSIIESFELEQPGGPRSLVLMHHEWRTRSTYPGPALSSIADLKKYEWLELWPNAGACMSVTKRDALFFGGFDEHSSFRGYLCGPYDLGWRLVNAGFPEVWHNEKIALWHFAHPDPPGSSHKFSWKLWREVAHPHVDYHALEAVEAFSTGRLLPLQENPIIHETRMSLRRIGSTFEAKYSRLTKPSGFSQWERMVMHGALVVEPLKIPQKLSRLRFRLPELKWARLRITWKLRKARAQTALGLLMGLKKVIGPRNYGSLKSRWNSFRHKKEVV